MVWLIILLIATATLFVLVQPFFRKGGDASVIDERDYLAAQLNEIEENRAEGYFSDAEAEAATLEARRRLLQADQDIGEGGGKTGAPVVGQISIMLIGAAPIAAIALYMALGNPGLDERRPEGAAASQLAAGQADNQSPLSLAASIDSLQQRLKDNPDDLDGWVMLAETRAATGGFAESAAAWKQAIRVAPERAFLHAAYGEALTIASNRVVTDEAAAAFDEALRLDPAEPRARFYKAIAAYQSGDAETALEALIDIANTAPAGAPWLSVVNEQIRVLAGELGRSVDELALNEGARAALSSGVSSAAALEERLASSDAPYTDWIALAEAYAGEGNRAKAAETLSRARDRYQAAPFVLQEIAAAEARLRLDTTASGDRRGPTAEQMRAVQDMSEDDRKAMIEGMVSGLAARLEEEPDDLEGWVMLARSYNVLGRKEESDAAFARAIEIGPDDLSVRLAQAEALLSVLGAASDVIDDRTTAALHEVERLNPDHPMALYFLGMRAEQQGDKSAAREYWTRLRTQMPPGSADAAAIDEMIGKL